MPLVIQSESPPDLGLPMTFTWDPTDPAQFEEATGKIKVAQAQGYKPAGGAPAIPLPQVGEYRLVPPERVLGTLLVRILDDSGDSRLVWNRHSIPEINEARVKFDAHIRKGYRAYAVRTDGSRGSRCTDFDALAEELILTQQKGKGKGEAVMVPPTVPG